MCQQVPRSDVWSCSSTLVDIRVIIIVDSYVDSLTVELSLRSFDLHFTVNCQVSDIPGEGGSEEKLSLSKVIMNIWFSDLRRREKQLVSPEEKVFR